MVLTKDVEQLIKHLGLEQHVEGGYFRRSYCAKQVLNATTKQTIASSIYYLLTASSRIGHFHKNKSDILHFYHGFGLIRYYLISEQGQLTTVEMGSDLLNGQQLQLLVPAGVWKASELIEGDLGLISEVVIPEFRFEDMVLAKPEDMALWDEKAQVLTHMLKQKS